MLELQQTDSEIYSLIKAEELEAKEQGMRTDLAAGMSWEDAYKRWGRA